MLKDFVSIYIFVAVSLRLLNPKCDSINTVSVLPTLFSSLASIAGKERLLSALSKKLSESNATRSSKKHSKAPGKVMVIDGLKTRKGGDKDHLPLASRSSFSSLATIVG